MDSPLYKKFSKNLGRSSRSTFLLGAVIFLVIAALFLVFSRLSHQEKLIVPNNDIEISQLPEKNTPSPSPEVRGRKEENISNARQNMQRTQGVSRKSRRVYRTSRKISHRSVTYKKTIATTKLHRYVVQRHDSLWKIAQKQYHSGYKWTSIYRVNYRTIGRNPHRIYPHQYLVLPAR